ncbi:MAG: glycerol-3-phosphate acyltransferase, partial [Ktedonobacterales bacterium]
MTHSLSPQRRNAGLPGAIALYAAAYLYGSLPFVYLLGRARQVDLRQIGSGNVGATNLLAAGEGNARWGSRSGRIGVAMLGWALDASKGLLPAVVARRLGFARREAGLAAVCGTAGQCWPLLLGLRGGRGISAFVGAAYAISPRAWSLTILPLIGGGVWRV